MIRSGTGHYSGFILETLFPGRCLVCGEWLLGRTDDTVPVCADCRKGLAPDRSSVTCSRCGTRLISEHVICRRCREGDFAFDSNTALFPYHGAIKELFQSLKFSGRARLAPLFAQWVAASLRDVHPGLSVVPVPSRPGRKTPHAVELVVRSLEKSCEIDVRRILARAAGAQQKKLDFSERRENLKGRISMKTVRHESIASEGVVLFDDVFTTGATLDACARTLREAGFQHVYGMTLVIEE